MYMYIVVLKSPLFFWQGSKKFLVLREIPEDKVKNVLSSKDSLAGCDIAIFVYDRLAYSAFEGTL